MFKKEFKIKSLFFKKRTFLAGALHFCWCYHTGPMRKSEEWSHESERVVEVEWGGAGRGQVALFSLSCPAPPALVLGPGSGLLKVAPGDHASTAVDMDLLGAPFLSDGSSPFDETRTRGGGGGARRWGVAGAGSGGRRVRGRSADPRRLTTATWRSPAAVRPPQHLLRADGGGQAHAGLLELLHRAAHHEALPDVLEEVGRPAVLGAPVLAQVRRGPVAARQRGVVGHGQRDAALGGRVVDDLPEVLWDGHLPLVGL